MPRMKLRDDEFDEKALDVDYEKSTFKRYTGKIPSTGTILVARVTKMWWTQSEAGNSMIKLIAVAEQNTGDTKQYNDLPTWEYLTFTPESAFRYKPFLENFGLTVRDIKRKMMVADEPDNIGDVIESIADWEVGSDDALCRIVVKRDRYDGEWRSKIDREGWLPYDEDDEPDDDEDDDEPDEEEPPARTRKAKPVTRSRRRPEPEPEDEDEDEDEPDDDEDDEPEDDDDEEPEDQEEEEPEEEAPARPARRTKSRAAPASSRSAPARSGTSRRGASATSSTDGGRARASTTRSRTSSKAKRGSTDDPPF